MKQLNKIFANIKNQNKLIQIVLTFCLCFTVTFLLTFIFNNKFKFIEKFSHPNCKKSHDFRTYYFHSDTSSNTNSDFLLKWNQLIDNDSKTCYIKAPKNINDLNDDTYKKFTEYYGHPLATTSGNFALFLGENLKDEDKDTKSILNISNLKDNDANFIGNKIQSFTESYNNTGVFTD